MISFKIITIETLELQKQVAKEIEGAETPQISIAKLIEKEKKDNDDKKAE